VEARPLQTLTTVNVAGYLMEEWVCRYGALRSVTTDGGPEFKGEVIEAVERAGAKLGRPAEYYPEGHGMIERGHKPLKDALVKLCGEDGKKWRTHLPAVLLADRISTKRSTGYSPYEILFGHKAVLPVDVEEVTYLAVDWWRVKKPAELLEARTQQLMRRDEMMKKAYQRLKKTRESSVRYWDKRCAHRLRSRLKKGDLVLLYNRSLESQWGRLFSHRWNGPYRVTGHFPGGAYSLEELDGTPLARKAAAAHVKKFYPRGCTEEDETEGRSVDGEEEDGDAKDEVEADGSLAQESGPRRSSRLKGAGASATR